MSTSFADRKLAYREFLKSDKWQDFRLRKLVKSNGVCWSCGKEGWNHDVHHLVYKPNWNDTSMDDCIVLCRDCHCRVHAIMEEYPEIMKLDSRAKKLKLLRKYLNIIKNGIDYPEGHPRHRKPKQHDPIAKAFHIVFRSECKKFGIKTAPYPKTPTLIDFFSLHGPHNRDTLLAFMASATTETFKPRSFPKTKYV